MGARAGMTPNSIHQQGGVALLFVVMIIFSLALLLPHSFRQLAQGYDLVALEMEKQRVQLVLNAALGLHLAEAERDVLRKKEGAQPVIAKGICSARKMTKIESVREAEYQIAMSCEQRDGQYHLSIEALLMQAGDGAVRRFMLDRRFPR